ALRRAPGEPVDQGLAVGAQGALQPEQTRMGSRGDDPSAGPAHVDHARAREPGLAHLDLLQALARHRLHRKPPELRNSHRALLFRANLFDHEKRLVDSTPIRFRSYEL